MILSNIDNYDICLKFLFLRLLSSNRVKVEVRIRDAVRYQISCFFIKFQKRGGGGGGGSFPFIENYDGKFCIFWRALAYVF